MNIIMTKYNQSYREIVGNTFNECECTGNE